MFRGRGDDQEMGAIGKGFSESLKQSKTHIERRCKRVYQRWEASLETRMFIEDLLIVISNYMQNI